VTNLKLNELAPTKPLLILDLANNHNGSLAHGKQIIDDLTEVVGIKDFQVAIKFQYRDLPNFIHPDFRERRDLKYVDRFLSTLLRWSDFQELVEYIKEKGFLTACTPFDEFSVDKIKEHGFDILKIASASFTDWPLLEAAVTWEGPIVASTAGASLEEIDRVVAFLNNRNKNFAIMHCVAAYPTTDDSLELRRISRLKERYIHIPIGYSTHEDPNNTLAGPIALGAGAVILERHVGSPANNTALNGYSSEKKQLDQWISNLKLAIRMLGHEDSWNIKNESEIQALSGLRRYAFANRDIKPGDTVTVKDVFFAIPGDRPQIQANDFGKYEQFVAKVEIKTNEGISSSNVASRDNHKLVYEIRDKIVELIKDSGVVVPRNSVLEISHHYGLEKFYDFGTCMITVVNREYCKKLIIMLPGQNHPNMHHKIKDETFFLLHGDLDLKLDGKSVEIKTGDTVAVPPGVSHEFSSSSGAILEEVSSSHLLDDSYYDDEAITNNPYRKTHVQYWV
jgi:sialic acid synthase SpsE/mannose-6-phosphate isomerase-like protein (cupin superfamily)